MSESNPSQLDAQEQAVHPEMQTVVQPAVAAPPPAYAGRARGAVNYTRAELMVLLRLMERIVPVNAREWRDVFRQHCIQFPGRTVDSLKRKFTLTHRKQAPTGDPDISPDVRLAKEVKDLIGNKACLGGGEDV